MSRVSIFNIIINLNNMFILILFILILFILVHQMILALLAGILVAVFLRRFIGLNLFKTKDKVSERSVLTLVTQVRIRISWDGTGRIRIGTGHYRF